MPYKLSTLGYSYCFTRKGRSTTTIVNLTKLQMQALAYLYEHKDENRYIDAHEVATFYGYKNGMWFRGVLASLHKRGLLDKKPGE